MKPRRAASAIARLPRWYAMAVHGSDGHLAEPMTSNGSP
jgi:hypothetical protein